MNKENSMCIIPSKKVIKGKLENIKGSGFFLHINNQDLPFKLIIIFYSKWKKINWVFYIKSIIPQN